MTSNQQQGGASIPDEYDRMLDQLDALIQEMASRIDEGEIHDVEKAQLELQEYRTFGYLIRTQRLVLKDRTLEALSKELAELRENDEPTTDVHIGSSTDS